MPHEDLPVANGTGHMHGLGPTVLLQSRWWLRVTGGEDPASLSVGAAESPPGSMRPGCASVADLESFAVNDSVDILLPLCSATVQARVGPCIALPHIFRRGLASHKAAGN